MVHEVGHKSHRSGWLRAAVLGANDGLVSTASLIIGVTAASAEKNDILLAGVAGLVAGAMSMAAGEYVSVSSQADTEAADLAIEAQSLAENPHDELMELTHIYHQRGLDQPLALKVASKLMAHDALASHARDDIGIIEHNKAQPFLAAWSSAATFVVGAALPLLITLATPLSKVIPLVAIISLFGLGALGAIAAHVGGASRTTGALRVTFWGALAMAATAFIGTLFGVVT